MRICLVVNTFPSVSETYIYNKAVSLALKGHKIHIVCHKKNVSKDNFLKYDLESSKIKVHVLSLSKTIRSVISSFFESPAVFFQSLSLDKKAFRKNYVQNYYVQFFGKIKYDIIHFEFSGLAASFLPVMDELKGKKVVSCRGTSEKVKLQINNQRKELLSGLFRKVDLIHCVSEDMKKTVAPFCSDLSKIFINTSAIDISFFSTNKIKADVTAVKILSIGPLNFQKNYLTGILALKILADSGHHFHWTIVGEGQQLEELQFHVFNLSLERHVDFLTKRNKEEIKTLLEESDIFLVTSVFEGIPNVLLEAMSMRLPVVSTHCGGIDEVIDHGIDGFIAELYDHKTIADYLVQLINNFELRNTIGEAARKKIENNFAIDNQTKIFEDRYRSLLRSSN